MQIHAKTAVVDNDFVNHLVDSHMDDQRLIDVLKLVFSELGLSAAMHPLVYQYELLVDKNRIRLLFDTNVIGKAEFEDIFQDSLDKKEYYVYLLKNLYRSLKGETFPIPDEEIFTRWVRKKSLGEIHSVVMCLICGCCIFLSDDGDSKALRGYVERMSIGNIEVYNRDDFIDLHMQRGETKLGRKERQSLTHSASR